MEQERLMEFAKEVDRKLLNERNKVGDSMA